MVQKKQTDNTYLVSWDSHGFEAIINVTEKEKEALFTTLKGESPNFQTWLQHTVSRMMLRARFNTQQHYEIYSFRIDSSVSEESLKKMFEENPQGMADLIREKGVKIYSDRALTGSVKIV